MSRATVRVIPVAAAIFIVAVAALFWGSPGTVPWAAAQTVPTITPTSPPTDEATAAPGATEPPEATAGATQPGAQPTATRRSAGLATATRTGGGTTARATAGPSPTPLLSGTAAAWPTAEPCGSKPTAVILDGGAWVYEGPGEDYETIGRLEEETVRPLVARAAEARWWLIALDEDETGWVADGDVEVQGDTSDVPVEGTPALPDGTTPTPGATWQPTPVAECVTPTPTPTRTAAPSATPEPTETATNTPSPEPEEPAATQTPAPIGTEPAGPLPVEEEGSSLMWLPVAGLVLLAAGAFLYVTRRS